MRMPTDTKVETPRTDALLNARTHYELHHNDWYALVNHANQLERELTARTAELKEARKLIVALEGYLASARDSFAVNDRRNFELENAMREVAKRHETKLSEESKHGND